VSASATFDTAIVGGGLAGSAAAISLAREGLNVLHLAPAAPPDRRTSALMMPSVQFLRDSGLLVDPDEIGHPLTQIRVIDATERLIRAPETLFDSSEAGLEAFGWNLPNAALLDHFARASTGLKNLTIVPETLEGLTRDGKTYRLTAAGGSAFAASLIVGADGKKSLVRQAAGILAPEHDFSQSALVCDLELARPLDRCSVEFHYPEGPFTLVPAGENRANLVWIDQVGVLAEARLLDADRLATLFEEKTQHLFGSIRILTPAFVFPLSTLTAETAGRDGVVLVGEAAHAFPPIGAQGLNLGLRDVEMLTRTIASVSRSASDWPDRISERYAIRREGDIRRTGLMVNTLFRSLIAEMLPAQALRAGGLWALKTLPGLRRSAFAAGMGSKAAR
jgi:2-octaprenyl-6-methoxyphenol hydroxylase